MQGPVKKGAACATLRRGFGPLASRESARPRVVSRAPPPEVGGDPPLPAVPTCSRRFCQRPHGLSSRMSLSSSLSSSRSRSRPRLGTGSGAAMARRVQAAALRAIRRPAPPPLPSRPGPAPRRPAGSGAAAATTSSPYSGSGNWEARARGRPGGGARLPHRSRLSWPEPERRFPVEGRALAAPSGDPTCPPPRGPARGDPPRPRPRPLSPPTSTKAPPRGPRPVRGPAPPEAPSRWSCLVPNRLLPGLAALGCPGTSLRRAARAQGFPWRPGAGSVGASPGARRPAPTGPAQLWEPLVLPAPVPHHTPATHILKPGPVPGRPPWGEPSVERAGRSPLSPGITARVWGKGRNARRGGQLSDTSPIP